MNAMRPCTRVWLLLILLSCVTYGVGEAGLGGKAVVAMLLAISLIKSQMVAGFFMGLRRTSFMWRAIMGSYLVVVCGMIGVAYWMGATTV